MDFKPGPVSSQEAAELNALKRAVERLNRLTVAGGTLKIHRGPANIVIEGIPPPIESGGGPGFDLNTINFTVLDDVAVSSVVCNPGGSITVTLTKTFKRVSITGAELSVTVTPLD